MSRGNSCCISGCLSKTRYGTEAEAELVRAGRAFLTIYKCWCEGFHLSHRKHGNRGKRG